MTGKGALSRRTFLKAGAAAGWLGAAPCFVPSRALAGRGRPGANERVHVGVIGAGVRGKHLIANLPPTARVTAICDCYLPRVADTLSPKGDFAPILEPFRDSDAATCRAHQDYRRMLDREQLDAVIIAAPDHHHALAAMLACQAGLDVYLEKPLTVAVAEGRALASAVRRSNRVLQVGSQQRTMEMNRFACEFLRAGGLGKISLVELPNYPGPLRPDRLPKEPAPQGLDWELFCGPTEPLSHSRRLWVKDEFKVGELLWRGWDLWRDFSGHLMTNWGAHSVDMVQFALGRDGSGPVEIWPETEALDRSLAQPWLDLTPQPAANATRAELMRLCPVTMRYGDGALLRFHHSARHAVFHGERGTLWMSRNKFHTDPPDLIKHPPDAAVAKKWEGLGHVARPHLENWLECVTTRSEPNAPVEAGHRTITVCHLANIARELGRRLHWRPDQERFIGDDQANALLDRPRRKEFELPEFKT